MKRYYYVSYLFNDVNISTALGSGFCFTVTSTEGIKLTDVKRELEEDSSIYGVTIINFKELTREEYLLNVKGEIK